MKKSLKACDKPWGSFFICPVIRAFIYAFLYAFLGLRVVDHKRPQADFNVAHAPGEL